jgi:hypothetical protein
MTKAADTMTQAVSPVLITFVLYTPAEEPASFVEPKPARIPTARTPIMPNMKFRFPFVEWVTPTCSVSVIKIPPLTNQNSRCFHCY